MTPEQEVKGKKFLKEYGELVKKHGIDIVAYPNYIPDGSGGWKLIISTQTVSSKEEGIKSPFVPEA